MARGGQQREAGDREREQYREHAAELVPQQPPGHPQRASERVPLAGEGVARRAVGHGEHQVGVPVEFLGAHKLGDAAGVVGDPQAAQHPPAQGVTAPGHVEGLARQPDVARRDLAERGRHQRGRGQLAARQHGAVAEEPGDVLAEPPVVGGDDQPQVRVELLGAQGRVEVVEVIGADQGHRAGGGDARVRERLSGQRAVLADGDARQAGDPRAVILGLVGQHDDDVLAVAPGEFPGDAVGERIVAAHDEVAAGHSGRGHGQDPIQRRALYHGKGLPPEGKNCPWPPMTPSAPRMLTGMPW